MASRGLPVKLLRELEAVGGGGVVAVDQIWEVVLDGAVLAKWFNVTLLRDGQSRAGQLWTRRRLSGCWGNESNGTNF